MFSTSSVIKAPIIHVLIMYVHIIMRITIATYCFICLIKSYTLYIASKNHILKGQPKAHHSRKKYQIRQVRLKLIHRWTKRCSRHYEATQPHRQKRLRTVNTFLKEPHFVSHYKARAKPVKPGSAYHDQPVNIPMGKGTCVICKKRTRWHCFGCCKELEGIYPVCSPSVRNCNGLHHRARNGT